MNKITNIVSEVFIICLILITCEGIQGQKPVITSTPAADKDGLDGIPELVVSEGDSVKLTCNAVIPGQESKEVIYVWARNVHDSYKFENNKPILEFTSINGSDADLYTCKGRYKDEDEFRSSNISIVVKYAPTLVKFQGAAATVVGIPKTMTCIVGGSQPAASVVWYLKTGNGWSRLAPGVETLIGSVYRQTVISSITVPADVTKSEVYMCQAYYGGSPTIKNSTTLTVQDDNEVKDLVESIRASKFDKWATVTIAQYNNLQRLLTFTVDYCGNMDTCYTQPFSMSSPSEWKRGQAIFNPLKFQYKFYAKIYSFVNRAVLYYNPIYPVDGLASTMAAITVVLSGDRAILTVPKYAGMYKIYLQYCESHVRDVCRGNNITVDSRKFSYIPARFSETNYVRAFKIDTRVFYNFTIFVNDLTNDGERTIKTMSILPVLDANYLVENMEIKRYLNTVYASVSPFQGDYEIRISYSSRSKDTDFFYLTPNTLSGSFSVSATEETHYVASVRFQGSEVYYNRIFPEATLTGGALAGIIVGVVVAVVVIVVAVVMYKKRKNVK